MNVSNLKTEVLKDVAAAVEIFRTRDVGALLIVEEALWEEQVALLASALAKQPLWSALPILVLTMFGRQTFHSRRKEWQQRLPLDDITLLERPVRVHTLTSSVKAALQARSTQYDRRRSEAALIKSEKLAAVGRVASSIAHEINNPLEAVTKLLYLLNGTVMTAEQQAYLDTAEQELARIS